MKVNLGNIKGPKGATGKRGSRWSKGTAITGTSATAAIFSGSEITDALVDDMYLNTSTMNVYTCTVAGSANVAKWVYACNIKGKKGDKGDPGNVDTSVLMTDTEYTALWNTIQK